MSRSGAARDDSRFVDFAGRGAYQGITRAHFVEIELPETGAADRPALARRAGLDPSDRQLDQRRDRPGRARARPQGLSLDVADAAGRFHDVRTGLGFPAGKDKTILIDLTGVFGATGPRRLRLATNLEIFWDRLGWAVGRPDVARRRRDGSSSRAPISRIAATRSPSSRRRACPSGRATRSQAPAPRWRDLEGYYTRFGDVRELLRTVDDRYVIMNAGDELRLRFPEAPPPAPGLVRDFVVVGDGWVKDGDYNTTLLAHGAAAADARRRAATTTPPGRLEDDPVYRAARARLRRVPYAVRHARAACATRSRAPTSRRG